MENRKESAIGGQTDSSNADLTGLLQRAAQGSTTAKQELYAQIYDDLRVSARRVKLRQPQQDLQTTDLVQEVLLRFEASNAISKFANRRVLFAVAIRAMRQVLIDHYRRRKKAVDSPDRNAVPLDRALIVLEQRMGYDMELLQLALDALEAESPRQSAVLNYRIFGGLSIVETAKLLDISRQTVERDWKLARAKLFRFMMNYSEHGS